MEMKKNDAFFTMIIAFVMILMFSTFKSITCANDDCFINCMKKCPAEDYQCYDRCGWDCPHNATISSQYCNLGCSFHHCAQLSKGLHLYIFFLQKFVILKKIYIYNKN